MIVVLTLFLISAAMAARDVLGTVLTVAEAKGRDRLAGLMDALGDVAQTVCLVLGVDSINVGLRASNLAVLAHPEAMLVLGTQMVTSYNVTRWATRRASRMRATSGVEGDAASCRCHPPL